MNRRMMIAGMAAALAALPGAPARADDGKTLAGTAWRVPDNPDAYLVFSSDRITGSTGCNRFFAGYEELADGAMTVSPAGATRMACGAAAMKFEHRFLSALEKVRRFEIVDKRLYLRGADLAVLLELEPDDRK